jgi:hypothetical protein
MEIVQYLQLPDKNFRDVSRYIYSFLAVFLNGYVFIPLFVWEPITMFCGTLWRHTDVHIVFTLLVVPVVWFKALTAQVQQFNDL